VLAGEATLTEWAAAAGEAAPARWARSAGRGSTGWRGDAGKEGRRRQVSEGRRRSEGKFLRSAPARSCWREMNLFLLLLGHEGVKGIFLERKSGTWDGWQRGMRKKITLPKCYEKKVRPRTSNCMVFDLQPLFHHSVVQYYLLISTIWHLGSTQEASEDHELNIYPVSL
jgi:hypothetical protein